MLNLIVNETELDVTIGGESVNLTRAEFKVLVALDKRKGKIVTREQLLVEAFGSAADIKTRKVDMTVSRLKAKLGEAGKLIQTVYGFGYRLKVEAVNV